MIGVRIAPGGTGDLRAHTSPSKLSNGFPRTEKLSRQVHRNNPFPLVEGHVGNRGVLLDARVVYKNIDRPKLFDDLGKHRLDLRLFRDVRLYGDGPAAELGNLVHHFTRPVTAPGVIDGNISARFSKRYGARFAYPGAPAGNQSRLPREQLRCPGIGHG